MCTSRLIHSGVVVISGRDFSISPEPQVRGPGLFGVPVAIAENPTNPPLTCGDVVLFGPGQRVLRRAAGSAPAVTWAEVCSPSWTYRPRLPRCRCRDLAWSSGAVRPPAARCWRAEWLVPALAMFSGTRVAV